MPLRHDDVVVRQVAVSDMLVYRDIVARLSSELDRFDDPLADVVCDSGCPDEQLWAFLVSDRLWGGTGSIADCGLIYHPLGRADLEQLLIRLGHAQIALGRTNARTAHWVAAMEQWQRDGSALR